MRQLQPQFLAALSVQVALPPDDNTERPTEAFTRRLVAEQAQRQPQE